MHRICGVPLLAAALIFPISLLGDTSGTVTLDNGTELNFSTGATGPSGGDILDAFDPNTHGSQIEFVNGAKGHLIPFSGPLNFSLGLADVQTYAGRFSGGAISVFSLNFDSVFLIETGGGVFGKAMVTSLVPLTILFDSFGTGNPNAPSVDKVLDAGSYTQYIAPGGVFVVKGTNLSPSGFTSTSYPLPTSSQGVSITFTPLVGGAATQAYMVYLYNEGGVNQLAGIAPSTLAISNFYYVTVTTPSGTSPPGVVDLISREPALVTQDATGNGLAVVQNYVSSTELDINRFTTGVVDGEPISPAHPGQTLIAWLTGMGAVPFADNTAPNGGQGYDFTKNGVTVQVNVGGMEITPFFAGRTPCCAGEDQVDFTLPANVPTGCTVAFQVQVGGRNSQVGFISIAPDADSTACVSPDLTAQQLQDLDQGGKLSLGVFGLGLQSESDTIVRPFTLAAAGGGFEQFTGFELAAFESALAPSAFPNGCFTYPYQIAVDGDFPGLGPFIPLDAGTVSLTGPSGSGLSNTALPETNDLYSTSNLQLLPGAYTLSSTGGKDVGQFQTTITVPAVLTVSNLPASVTRSAGLTLNWTGGNPSDTVVVSGRVLNGGTGGAFYCYTTAGAGGFTVPASVLDQLPATDPRNGDSLVDVEWIVNGGQFSAPLTVGGSVTNATFGVTVEDFARVPYQ